MQPAAVGIVNKDKKTALVAGATGVVGRNLLKYLVSQDDWEIIALSRRTPDVAGEYRHISVDLLDLDDCRTKLGPGLGVTHIFFAAYVEKETWAATVPPNVNLLRNLLDTVEPVSPDLCHVNLMQGSKWYGNHLGPYKTPAQEDDPRHMPPNFTMTNKTLWRRGRRPNHGRGRPRGLMGFVATRLEIQ